MEQMKWTNGIKTVQMFSYFNK